MLKPDDIASEEEPGIGKKAGGKMPGYRVSKLVAVIAIGIGVASAVPTAQADNAFESLISRLRGSTDDNRFANSNGRIEAQSVDVAGKYAGRLIEVLVHEGDLVGPNDIIARIDDRDLQTQLLGAKASVLQAKAAREQTLAAVTQAQSTLSVAGTNFDRITKLNAGHVASDASLDDARNALAVAEASLATARAQVTSSEALISVAEAKVAEINVAIEDLVVRSPIRGRVQYRLREPGEVVAGGTPVVTLLDLTDVYMNLYLGADTVGKLASGDEARLILDPVPQYVIPARVMFIAPEAQFSPKSVETQEERSQLVFRVKLTIPRDLLVKFEDRVKAGIRGVGFVRTDPATQWPSQLQVKLPQ
ncbi:HlyD family efflux transporter periplasmic adaptor subunit [Agrobacterium sp. MS2]|uniref:HlyD family secretion protein n=1 Tax=Agrobacterium sp. MS2 TaxID=1345498 RepID=UPI001AEC74B6|nr:HlyD family efflux transporter periplasmic adaptor subunit [Agrobacterium sp. MS2]